LTSSPGGYYNPFMPLRGTITCQRCGKKRNILSKFCSCGYDNVFLKLDYKGQRYRFFYDKEGRSFTITTAMSAQVQIDSAIRQHVFDPSEWIPFNANERMFSVLFEKFLEQKRKKLHPGTYHIYDVYYRIHFPPLHNTDVRDIRLKHLQGWYDGLPVKLSGKYKKNMTDCLRAFFNWLVRWGDLKECPIMPDIESPDSVPRTALEADTQIEQLAKIPEPFRDFIEFLMEAGLRPAEGCALKIQDYQRGRLLVQRTYSRNVLIETTKGKNKMWRTLSTRANALVLHAIGNDINPDRFIFVNPATGRGYLPEFLRKMWRTHTTVPQDLYSSTRHSLGTQLAESGTPKKYIQEILGHKDGRSTDVYMHPSDSRKREYLDNRNKVVDISKKRQNDR